MQTFDANIDHGINFLEKPEDDTEDRFMVEVHYYDPYEFSLQENEVITQWAPEPLSTSAKP